MRPWRLLLIDPTGGEPAERMKAHALARAGFRVRVLAPRRVREGQRMVEAVPETEAPFGFMTGEVAGKPPNRNIFLSGLQGALRGGPDVVHVLSDENFAMTAQVVLEAQRLAPSALVVAHSWQNVLTSWRRHPQPSTLLYAWDTQVERVVFAGVAGMVARNHEAQGVLRQRGYGGPVKVIPWGVDVEGVQARSHDAVPGGLEGLQRPLLGYVGRLVPEKGVGVLLDALTRGLPGTLVLVGEGPHKRQLIEKAEQLGLQARVRFLGAVQRSQVPAILSRLDVLLLPSLETKGWKEQFGRVLVEAMAVGTPCVGSNSGAIPDVVGDAGAVFPVGDASALVQSVREVLLERPRYSSRARARAAVFSWDAFARETATFLHTLLDSARA